MKKYSSVISSLLAVIILVIAVIYFQHANQSGQVAVQNPSTPTPLAAASYVCDEGKTIDASFFAGTSTAPVVQGQPPTPTGTALIKLSDGRIVSLSQTISADGARYANDDGSVVFWNKGNGAFVLENNQQTYTGCIAVKPDAGGYPNIYQNGSYGFTLRYPIGYSLDDAYTYQELGPGNDIDGIKFTIPASLAKGTNLSPDTYISIEHIATSTDCSAALFLDDPGAQVQTTTDNGTVYSMAASDGAGAGNRYEEIVYALPGTNPCIAVRYFIHYGVLENYPAGIIGFDSASLIGTFDNIRRTLVINQ